jgi:HSP20 family protein
LSQRWDPLRDLVALQDRMNRLFEDAAHRQTREEDEEGARDLDRADWIPAADVYNREDGYLIVIDLPGIERESLDISVDNDRLWVRGVRNVEQVAQQRTERKHGRFLRKFGPLPPTINQEAIKAEYKDGVLSVHLPKRRESPSKRVEIKVQ